jgi:hypothetical protein
MFMLFYSLCFKGVISRGTMVLAGSRYTARSLQVGSFEVLFSGYAMAN